MKRGISFSIFNFPFSIDSSSLYCLDDDNFATILKHGFTPVGTGNDVEIHGDGNVARRDGVGFQYFGECRAGGRIRKDLSFINTCIVYKF